MKTKLTVGDVVFNFFNYTFFILFTLLCAFPFYYMIINSISANDLAGAGRILFIPRGIHFDNYVSVFNLRGLPMAAFISFSRTVLGTSLSVVFTGFLGFAISRTELWGRKIWYRFFVITMFFNAGLIPWFMTMRSLGLTNTFLVYIIGFINPFNLILVKTYIENAVPASIQESAEIDGAGYLTLYFKILMPLCKPILATIAIFTAVGHWNSFMDTVFLITNTRLFTLQYVLYQYLNEAQALVSMMRAAAMAGGGGGIQETARLLTPTSVRMTVSIVIMLPIMLVYPFFQRYFVKGIMVGAVKG